MTTTQRGTLLAAILGSAIVFLDGTIVNVALPRIGAELPSTLAGPLEGQTYVTSGYLATLAAFLVLAGRPRRLLRPAADLRDRSRRVRRDVGPLRACAELELLVVVRLLQGAAGALLVPGSLSIITALFEGPARARAFGIWAAATAAWPARAALGGILVDTICWRVAFLINVPLVLLALYARSAHMPESRDEQRDAATSTGSARS